MSTNTPKKPQLKDYLDVSHYLKDLYGYRKATEDGFSYESWAQEVGFQHRSFLRQVVIGRRALTDATAKQLGERLFFTKPEQEHFQTLARYSKCRTKQERDVYGQRLMQILKDNYYQTEVEVSEDFLGSPMVPRLQVLLSLGDKSRSIKDLSQALQADPLEIEKGLLVLLRLNLVELDGDNYKATVNSFKVPAELGSEVLLDYHKKILQDAIAARNLPHDQRRYKSLLMAMSPEEFEQFLNNMNAFAKEQLQKFDNPSVEGRRLFQVNLNLFSVSTELT
ncbi:TIGR02147 family protein [Bdellovibrio svalbardensis]|uniref:DUF4423 domain-containing protein n=1 Tax=Bdellovibrio svalbardensis TaxID=2972972 RepID=A0ABT6DK77_9BACT|nr:TIGR02147 family protein [Bdellovibrio svalbardensis]MDG0816319.1 DUF4423 domain-containing protein [Bdellovibrio svalbardensis]